MGLCINLLTHHICECNKGYYDSAGDGMGPCLDIDECDTKHSWEVEQMGATISLTPNDCDLQTTECFNLDGTYECPCLIGYTRMGPHSCTDIDECSLGSHSCDSNAFCTNTVGSYTCDCPLGYDGLGYIKDGSYNGIKAAPDIEKQYKGAQGCYDLDECLVGALQEKDRQYIPHKCQPNSYCENTAGSYQCICDEGYEGNGMVHCDLEDECSAVKCGAYAHCSTTPPDVAESFIAKDPALRLLGNPANCYCDPGFIPDPDPKDRCKKDCEIGYQATGPRCTDINECVLGTHDCALDTGICTNTEGSYGCKCMPGYDGDGRVCNNFDECALSSTQDCDLLAECEDLDPGYKCNCIIGYEGRGFKGECRDIDECFLRTHACALTDGQDCQNTPGSYVCPCLSGYEIDSAPSIGNLGTCKNIDECSTGTHKCDINAACVDSTPIPDYRCFCNQGYQGDGFYCTLIDYCMSGPCPLDAICVSLTTGPICDCADGYNPHYDSDGKLGQCEKIHSINLKPDVSSISSDVSPSAAPSSTPAGASTTASSTTGTNILLMASIQNVPILKFDFDGNLDDTLKFQIDTDASVYGACTATLNNEVYVFGGYYAKQLGSETDKPNFKQISKINNGACELQKEGDLSFDFEDGTCGTYGTKILLGFDKNEPMMSHYFVPGSGTTAARRTVYVHMRAKLASYSGNPVILGSDNDSGNCAPHKYFDPNNGRNWEEDSCNIKMEILNRGPGIHGSDPIAWSKRTNFSVLGSLQRTMDSCQSFCIC